jgi:hypothetical protein
MANYSLHLSLNPICMNYLEKPALRCLAIALLFFVGSVKATAQTQRRTATFDSLKAVKEIAGENKKYTDALSKSDSAAISNLYTRDARILNNGGPSTIGRTEVMHFYGGMIRNGVTGFSYTTIGVWGTDNNLT